MSFSDISFMQRALLLAQQAQFDCPPNPAVGCVIVKDRQVIGEGYTQQAGGPHAEVMALRDCQARGEDPRGSTVYVTLEPCSHYGRTPPCALALKEAGVSRVVAAILDPNPLVAGKGLEMLRQAGVKTECGVCEQQAEEINRGFLKRMRVGNPWLRLKLAMSLDGCTALANGQSKWITSEEARADGQFWRARAGAILTGAGTVKADNPLLNVRLPHVKRQPLKVIVDSNLLLSPEAEIFQTGPVLLVCAQYDTVRAQFFEGIGVEVIELRGVDGKVDLRALMTELASREINEVHCEAGARLSGALAQLGLPDEYLIYAAPVLLGDGRRLLDMPQLDSLAQARRLQFNEISKIGADLRMVLRPLQPL